MNDLPPSRVSQVDEKATEVHSTARACVCVCAFTGIITVYVSK